MYFQKEVIVDKVLIVSLEKDLEKYSKIASEYKVGYEINDFCDPSVLDDSKEVERLISRYMAMGIPEGSTMHGAFFDVILHSRDKEIAAIARKRMKQSMEVARKLGLRAVVFHTNYQPGIPGDLYRENVINKVSEYMEELLREYSDVDIYLENMFEDDCKVLVDISKRLSKYDNYGVCLDYGHVIVYGGNEQYWAEQLCPYIKHLHINDNNLKEDLHLPLGTGQIDWEKFKKHNRCYFNNTKGILVEVTKPEEQRISLDYLRTLL